MITSRRILLRSDSLSEQLRTACLLEAAARKPGNVHPEAQFVDLTFEHFELAAEITGRELGNVREIGVGQAILNAVGETHSALKSNVNLGILLLLAPLAAVSPEIELRTGIAAVLSDLDLVETRRIYSAIQLSQPAGMGTVPEQDVSQPPDQPLAYAMNLAAERDSVARQYATQFADIFRFGDEVFLQRINHNPDWEQAIIGTQVNLMATFSDSLIRRKCGDEIAQQAAKRAQSVLHAGDVNTAAGRAVIEEFDHWLRADGHRRNPGTTADLIAAILFSLIRDGQWTPPDSITLPLPSKQTCL